MASCANASPTVWYYLVSVVLDARPIIARPGSAGWRVQMMSGHFSGPVTNDVLTDPPARRVLVARTLSRRQERRALFA